MDTERAAARERERAAEENAARISSARMDAETEDYSLPSRVRPVPEQHVVMTERQRIEARQRRDEIEAEERAEREEAQRPIREQTEQINKTHRKLMEVQRDTLLNEKVHDPDLFISPKLDGVRMSHQQATFQNIDAFAELFDNHSLAPSDKNFDFFQKYFLRHGVNIVDTQMLENLYQRAIACGIEFDAKREAEPDGATLDYSKRPNVEIRIAPAREPEKPKPQTYEGFDLITGEPRTYSAREIDKMSADDMKKALQMVARGTLELPRVGPGPLGQRYR